MGLLPARAGEFGVRAPRAPQEGRDWAGSEVRAPRAGCAAQAGSAPALHSLQSLAQLTPRAPSAHLHFAAFWPFPPDFKSALPSLLPAQGMIHGCHGHRTVAQPPLTAPCSSSRSSSHTPAPAPAQTLPSRFWGSCAALGPLSRAFWGCVPAAAQLSQLPWQSVKCSEANRTDPSLVMLPGAGTPSAAGTFWHLFRAGCS